MSASVIRATASSMSLRASRGGCSLPFGWLGSMSKLFLSVIGPPPWEGLPLQVGLPGLTVRVQDLDQASAGIAQAPADYLPGPADVLGDLLVGEPVSDPLHDLPLRPGQLADRLLDEAGWLRQC